MENKQILEKAIQKAIDGGWGGESSSYSNTTPRTEVGGLGEPSLEEIIFNHDFAKALWGEEDCSYETFSNRWNDPEPSSGTGGPDEDWYNGATWEFHLQQMVISNDPIKYLGEHLDG